MSIILNRKILIILLLAFTLVNCKRRKELPEERDPNITLSVKANVETTPVISFHNEDAADDPAIWVNDSIPEQSLIVGTNKKSGLSIYNLKGEEIYYAAVGMINNVDIREITLNSEKIVLVAGSNRSNNSIALFKLNTLNGKLTSLNAEGILTTIGEVYGFCLYQNTKLNKTYAFINGKSGIIEQWELIALNDTTLSGNKVRTLNVDTQPEGMVADDELNFLYVGEEDRGIWKFSALENGPETKTLIANSDQNNPMIKYDIEGLAIYYQPNGKGYLLASSQGNYSYAVFNRDSNNEYLFSFFIDDGNLDGVEETDGIEVTNRYLSSQFPNGVFIAQDGYNFNADSLANQNFKLVDWNQIAQLYNFRLLSDSSYISK